MFKFFVFFLFFTQSCLYNLSFFANLCYDKRY